MCEYCDWLYFKFGTKKKMKVKVRKSKQERKKISTDKNTKTGQSK